MASGPEHYRDAERNIDYAKGCDLGSPRESFHLQMAMIHATLANAAATALNDSANARGDRDEWEHAVAKTAATREEGC